MDPKYPPVLRYGPEQAGFDGAAGIGLNHKDMPDGGIFRLRRGSTDPREDAKGNYRNQLIWFMPDGRPAQLLWCNSDGVWFTCVFEREDVIDERELLDAMHSIVPQPYQPDTELKTLKEQALDALYAIEVGANDMRELRQDINTIRLALEQLDA